MDPCDVLALFDPGLWYSDSQSNNKYLGNTATYNRTTKIKFKKFKTSLRISPQNRSHIRKCLTRQSLVNYNKCFFFIHMLHMLYRMVKREYYIILYYYIIYYITYWDWVSSFHKSARPIYRTVMYEKHFGLWSVQINNFKCDLNREEMNQFYCTCLVVNYIYLLFLLKLE